MIGADECTTQEMKSLVEVNRLTHELQVHQIELEMQNKELLRTQHELEVLRESCFILFDSAPVGYLAIDEQGNVLEANPAVAELLGTTQGALFNSLFINYIFPDDQVIYYRMRKQSAESVIKRLYEIRMKRADGSILLAELKQIVSRNNFNLIVLKDITEQKRVEHALNKRVKELNCLYKISALANVQGITEEEFLRGTVELLPPNWQYPDIAEACIELDGRHFRTAGFRETPWMQTCSIALHGESIGQVTVCYLEQKEACGKGPFLIEELHLIEAVAERLALMKGMLDRELNEKRLELLSELNDISAATEDEILDFSIEACLITVQSQFAFIGLMNEDETVMTIHAWSNGAMAQCAMDSAPKQFLINEAGLWGECVRQRTPTVVNDYDAMHSPKRGCPAGHVPIKRFLGIPIFDGDRIIAVAAASNKEKEYTRSDIHALTILMERMFDLIHRRRAEEEQRKANEYLDSLFSYASAPIIVWDDNFTITRFNRAFEMLTGLGADTIIGNHLALLFPYEQIERSLEIITDPHAGDRWESVEIPIQHADGTVRTVLWNSSTIFEADGTTPLATIAHGIDITERRRAEEELLQAKIAAEAANQAKSDFLSTMSHEIRTPLSAMMGNIELLAESELTPEQEENLRDCRTSARMLLQVINDVLDFSKIEAGKLELNEVTFSPTAMARQLVRIFTADAKQKGLALTLSVADGLPAHISGDQYRLRQIVSNLISNAIKFTDYGAVLLEIGTEQPSSGSSPDSVILLISVRDTGIGIPQDSQALIFGSFTQVENFTTRRHAGSGLGLAICRRLAEMMGGTISLSSEPGEGSVFTVSLPVTVCQAPAQRMSVKRVKNQVATPRHILLADDEELGRNVTAALLQRRGHRVTAVRSGFVLLEELQRQKYDIVLSDISMPDMDGMEVARIIRSGKRAGIDTMVPIIALTAHAFVHDQTRFLASGINGYAPKPLDFEDLLRQIDELCGKSTEQSVTK